LKVVHINNSDARGGPALAARRLHVALRNLGVDSKMLVQESSSGVEHIVQAAGKFKKARASTVYTLERMAFLRHERNSAVHYGFSAANSGVDISDHPLVEEADIIHLHWINQGFISLKSLEKIFAKGKPIIWTLHDMWPFTGGCHYSGTCLEFLERCSFCPYLKKPSKNDLSSRQFDFKKKLYRNANLQMVACSRWIRALSSESSLFRQKEVMVIPNPIDVDLFKPKDKAKCRESLGLPQDKKLLLFGAANISDMRKGARYLFEAVKILVDSFPVFKDKVEIMIFGKMSNELKEGIKLKIHNFKIVSDAEKLVSLYNAADIFVLPSLQDNLPNTVVEAFACGTPVVAFSTGGVPEMVKHMQTGFLAESKNALNLASGIYETLFLSDLAQMRINARKRVVEKYAGDIVANQYAELYKRVIKERTTK